MRQALAYAFDFEWTNRTIMYGQYARTELLLQYRAGAEGLPSAAELALLEPFRDQLPEEVFTQVYHAPSAEGEGGIRQDLRTALRLLGEAGWQVEGGKLVNAQGQPFRFEILLNGPSFERHTLPFVKNLERLGIEATVRTVDPAQYQNRMNEFDFDMTVEAFGQSLSPGNEQRDYWGSEAADIPGSRNTIGIKDPVVDHLIDKIIQAPTREDLVTATRAGSRPAVGPLRHPHWHTGRSGSPTGTSSTGRTPIRPTACRCSAGGSTRSRSPRWSSARPRRGAKAGTRSSERQPCWPISSAACC